MEDGDEDGDVDRAGDDDDDDDEDADGDIKMKRWGFTVGDEAAPLWLGATLSPLPDSTLLPPWIPQRLPDLKSKMTMTLVG